jgi:hypothetical protein
MHQPDLAYRGLNGLYPGPASFRHPDRRAAFPPESLFKPITYVAEGNKLYYYSICIRNATLDLLNTGYPWYSPTPFPAPTVSIANSNRSIPRVKISRVWRQLRRSF